MPRASENLLSTNRRGGAGNSAWPFALPAADTRRWVPRRKAAVIAAVRGGGLSLDEACRRYGLSSEEFASWERLVDRHGLAALSVTRLKEFRSPPPGAPILAHPAEGR